jgi:hypothetical protein
MITDRLKSVPDIIKGVDQANENIGYTPFTEGRLTVKETVDLHPSVDGDLFPIKYFSSIGNVPTTSVAASFLRLFSSVIDF